jgi:hypothetical protein
MAAPLSLRLDAASPPTPTRRLLGTSCDCPVRHSMDLAAPCDATVTAHSAAPAQEGHSPARLARRLDRVLLATAQPSGRRGRRAGQGQDARERTRCRPGPARRHLTSVPSAPSTLGVDRLDRVPWPRLRPAVRVPDGALRDALCAAIHRGTNHVVGCITHIDALGSPHVLGMGRSHALTGVQCHWEATLLRRDLLSGQDTADEFRRGQQPTRTERNP